MRNKAFCIVKRDPGSERQAADVLAPAPGQGEGLGGGRNLASALPAFDPHPSLPPARGKGQIPPAAILAICRAGIRFSANNGRPQAFGGLLILPKPSRRPTFAKMRPRRFQRGKWDVEELRGRRSRPGHSHAGAPARRGRVPRLQTALRQFGRHEEAELCEAAAGGPGERHGQRMPGPRRRVS